MHKSNATECSVVAFYGIQMGPEGLEELYAHLIQWFNALGGLPDKLGIRGDGFSGKVNSFNSMDARLKKSGFQSVRGLSIYTLEPGGSVPLWNLQGQAMTMVTVHVVESIQGH
jgi:hypothetical protein